MITATVPGSGVDAEAVTDTGSYDADDACRPHIRGAAPRHERRSVSKLRLLVFSPYFPPHVGGLEGYVSDLDDALLSSGEVEEITVFTPRLPPEGAATEVRGPGCSVIRYPAYELIPNFPVPKVWSRELWRCLRAAGPRRHDVFVSHTRFFLSSAFALVCGRAVSRPLLHVEHGSDYVQLSGHAPRTAARLYDMLVGRMLLRHADAVVAISQAAAEFVQRLARREATVVYRGMWIARLEATVADADVLGWAAGRPVVSFVGRLIDGKGVPDLLRAYAEAGTSSSVLCIVGDGPRRVELEALAGELGLEESVRFLGYLTEERAWAVTRASDVVVNPSYTEGLPTSVLEAALLGRAVLATDVGGTPEIVTDGESGLLFKARDLDALRMGLERLLADAELRERMGRAARASASGRFDWSASAARFADIARGVMAIDGSGRVQEAGAREPSSTAANVDS
jgi:glycosyltransferase involved in cell wall biosynthesis